MNNVCCPVCGSLKYWPKYVNYQEIILCNSCGYWNSCTVEDSLGLSDLNEDKEKDNHLVDSD